MSCNPHRVRVNRIVERKVTLDKRTVQRINDNRPIVRADGPQRRTSVNVERNVLAPTVRPVRLDVGKGGPKGDRGPIGPAGGTIPPIEFAWGDAPSVVYEAPDDGVFTIIRVDVTAAFNAGATIKVGIEGEPEALQPAQYNNPLVVDGYENTADLFVLAGTKVWLQIEGATQGTGVLYLTFLPES